MKMSGTKRFSFTQIDGPEFRKQRELVFRLAEPGAHVLSAEDAELLRGLSNLLDEIADEAHDRYRVDCLLEPGA
jgi:hypothetical protein